MRKELDKRYFNVAEVIYPNVVFNQEYMVNEQGEVFSPYRGWHQMKTQKIKKKDICEYI